MNELWTEKTMRLLKLNMKTRKIWNWGQLNTGYTVITVNFILCVLAEYVPYLYGSLSTEKLDTTPHSTNKHVNKWNTVLLTKLTSLSIQERTYKIRRICYVTCNTTIQYTEKGEQAITKLINCSCFLLCNLRMVCTFRYCNTDFSLFLMTSMLMADTPEDGMCIFPNHVGWS